MRNDLQFLEQVDNYLTGQMNASDKLTFENSIQNDPELNSIFQAQKNLIQAAKRTALIAEIEGVAAGFTSTSWIALNAKWILSVIAIGAITTASIFIFKNDTKSELSNKQEPLGDSTSKTTASIINDTNETEKAAIPEGFVAHIEGEEGEDYTIFPVGRNFSFFPTFREFNKVKAHVFEQSNNEIAELNSSEISTETSSTNKVIYNRAASFPEGNLALKTFINSNLSYPQEAAQKHIEGNVKVDFVVGEDGSISEMQAQCFNLAKTSGEFTEPFSALQMFFNKKISKAFEEEALRMLSLMPKWIYATNNRGKAMASDVRLYFDFNYPSETLVYQLEQSTVKKNKSGGWKYQ